MMTTVGTRQTSASSAATDGRGLLRPWTWRVAVAESLGFLAPAVAGLAAVDAGGRGIVLLLFAGAIEGSALGAAQVAVLRRAVPALTRIRWVTLTAAAAVVAYALGCAIAFVMKVAPIWLAVATAVIGAPALLLTIGTAQWLELRHHVPRAGRWIVWTATAWLLALLVFIAIATPLWHEGQRTEVAVMIGAAAGTAMAFVQAAVTGYALSDLFRLSPSAGSAHVTPSGR